MWQYTRRVSLTPHAQTLVFAGHKVMIDADGQVISEVTPALMDLFKSSSAWKHSPSKAPEMITKAVMPEVALDGEDCDILPETKPRSTTSRSRRKSPKTPKVKD